MKNSLLSTVVFFGILFCLMFAALAAVYQHGEVRGMEYRDMKVVLRQDGDNWKICEDAALFSCTFATVIHPHDMMNVAEARELAKAVAVAVAKHLGSTNDVRIVRYETPPPASTNVADRLEAWLKGKDVTIEVVPLR